ncbi:MAG: WecB/TagA/CpsF family glycosyltransferase [Treponema sp.]|nr:WecB/TagA/CpsF family glycosyltransferase [Treponema sp.]
MAIKKIKLLGVPVDVCPPQDFEKTIMDLLEKEGSKQIVFLSVWDLLKARRKNSYAECVRNADLVIPVSKSIISGAKFLKKDVPYRWNPFETVINIMTVLETHYKSIYLLGGRKKTLMAAEKNVRNTFGNLQIVGRYVGYYPKSVEHDVISAIYKASPSLVLMSAGVRERDCWFYNHRENFDHSIFLYFNDVVDIFSERKKHVSKSVFEKGNEIWGEIMRNPLKTFLIFPFIWYRLLLVWYRLFVKE